MINSELFNLIKEKTIGYNTKILFVGDEAQIPPVGEKMSVIFFQEDIEKHVFFLLWPFLQRSTLEKSGQ